MNEPTPAPDELAEQRDHGLAIEQPLPDLVIPRTSLTRWLHGRKARQSAVGALIDRLDSNPPLVKVTHPRTGAPVARIAAERGRVVGVELENGERLGEWHIRLGSRR